MLERSGCFDPCLFVLWIYCDRGSVAQWCELQHLVLHDDVASSRATQGGAGEGLGNTSPQGKKIRLCGFISIACAMYLWTEV